MAQENGIRKRRKKMANDNDFTGPLATIASSPVRQMIVALLSSSGDGMSYSEIKESVVRHLGRKVTDGNLVWHLDSASWRLEKLKLAGVIEIEDGKGYTLNGVGRRLDKLVKQAKASQK
jgi:hypothetical protein